MTKLQPLMMMMIAEQNKEKVITKTLHDEIFIPKELRGFFKCQLLDLSCLQRLGSKIFMRSVQIYRL